MNMLSKWLYFNIISVFYHYSENTIFAYNQEEDMIFELMTLPFGERTSWMYFNNPENSTVAYALNEASFIADSNWTILW